MREKVLEIISRKYPDGATPEQLFDLMYSGGCVNDTSIRFFVVGSEFWHLMKMDRARTASDIQQQLSEDYDIHFNQVRYIRTKFARGGSRKKGGSKKR